MSFSVSSSPQEVSVQENNANAIVVRSVAHDFLLIVFIIVSVYRFIELMIQVSLFKKI